MRNSSGLGKGSRGRVFNRCTNRSNLANLSVDFLGLFVEEAHKVDDEVSRQSGDFVLDILLRYLNLHGCYT